MSRYIHGDPRLAAELNALPNVEVFHMSAAELAELPAGSAFSDPYDPAQLAEDTGPGWYWWACMPGCLPDSEPFGPFATEQEAIDDAQSGDWYYSEEPQS